MMVCLLHPPNLIKILTDPCVGQLAGDFVVWSLSPEARLLHGRFVHSNWDVNELKAKKEEILKNPELYTIGLLGW